MTSFSKAVTDINERLIKLFKEAAEVAMDPNPSLADIDKVFLNLYHACRDAKYESLNAAYHELKEHLTRELRVAGMSGAEADRRFDQKWKSVIDLSDRVRRAAPTVKKVGEFLWLKVVGAIAAGGLSLYGILNQPPAMDKNLQRVEEMRSFMASQDRIMEQLRSFKASEDQFNIMVDGLGVPSAPEPARMEPARMPITVAAAAPNRVQVEVTTTSGTQTFVSTVGRVYQNVPEARHQIEQATATPATHDSDHSSRFHKEFTVNSPIGSAHFKY
jgi:hypothetical protein